MDAVATRPTLPPALFELPVLVVEAALLKLPALDLPVRHYFADGVCARELTIPAGCLLTSRRHLTRHLCFVARGEITVWGDGVEPHVVHGPCTIVGEPGTRRIGYAHTETVWTTVFLNAEGHTDADAMLDVVTEIPEMPQELMTADAPQVLREVLRLSEGSPT